MKKKSLRKSRIFKILALGMLVSVPIAFTSCSDVSQSSLDNSFLSNNKTNFSDNFSLKDMALQALKTDSGQNAFLSYIAGQLSWNWFVSVSQKDSEYKSLVDNQKDLVDQQWNDLVSQYKQKYGGDWALKLQQDVLDPNGGDVNSWKQIQLNNWAKNELQSKLFDNNYIGILTDANGSVNVSPTADEILTALKNSTSSSTTYPQYGFSANAVQVVNQNTDPYYSAFQKFIYGKYICLENPFVIVSSLWKYSQPTNGINSIYSSAGTSSSSDGSSSTGDAVGSYAFPYFDNSDATNQAMGTIDKYTNFMSRVESDANFVTDTTTGLKNIPLELSDDASTYLLVKSSDNFSDSNIDIGLAAASSYMYGILGSTSNVSSGIAPIQITKLTNISKTITPTTADSDGLDLITKEFVSKSSIFPNATNKQVQLSSDYVTSLINPTGPLKSLSGNSLYTVDSFLPTLTSNGTNVLSDYIFIRDIDGVRAVAIDGDTFINAATSLSDKQQRSGDILLYHYLMNKGGYSDFDVDILSELKNFYTDNLNWLIVDYALSDTSTNKMFDWNSLPADISSAKDVLTSLINYVSLSSYVSNPDTYANKMIQAKSSYASNYGIDASKNGLASCWVYDNLSADDATYYDLNANITYNNILTSVESQQISRTTGSTYLQDYQNLKTTYLTALNSYINNLSLGAETSDFEGFKYSQYVLSNSVLINQTIQAYADGDTSSTMSTYIENNLISNYLGLNNSSNTFFDVNNYQFLDPTYQNYLNDGLANYFFDTTFNSQTNKWTEYTANNSSTSSSGTTSSNFEITESELNNYKKLLWVNSLANQDNLNSPTYLSLLTVLYTVNYLMENDFSNFLDYMQNKVAYGTDTYLVWSTYCTNLINSAKYNATPSSITQSSLLDASSSFLANVNNNYSFTYLGNNGESNGVNQNTNGSIFNDATNYYNVVGQKLGFYGIQTSSSNTLPEDVSNALFTNGYKYLYSSSSDGSLYSYGSQQELISYINNLSTIDAVNSLITTLRGKLTSVNANFGDLLDTSKTLKEKKDGLISIIENDTIPQMYQSVTSSAGRYLTDTNQSSSSTPVYTYGTDDNQYYATYVIQINQDSFKSLDSFLSTFGTSASDSSTNSIAYDVFFNLLIQAAATDTNLQSMALESFSYANKINVYDVRLDKQLGYQWVKNWKNITTSSS